MQFEHPYTLSPRPSFTPSRTRLATTWWRCLGLGMLAGFLASATVVSAQTPQSPIPVVTSTSIVADWVQQVGGKAVQVQSLVGRMQDPHGFQPKPSHAQALQGAKVIFMIGLGLEGWLGRMPAATKAIPVFLGDWVLGKAPTPAAASANTGHDHEDEEEHNHEHTAADPHVWQDLRLAARMVGHIATHLCRVDAQQCPQFQARAQHYSATLLQLDAALRKEWARVPPSARFVVVPHRAFDYYGQAYGVNFVSPLGVSSADNAAAARMAALLRRIETQPIRALFSEQGDNPKLMQTLAQQANRPLSGALWSDTLSLESGPAASYLALMRTNSLVMLQAIGVRAPRLP